FSVSFSSAPPVGTTVTLTPYGPCALSSTREGPPASGPLTVGVPSGRSRVEFWLEGLSPGGECTISASTNASGYNTTSTTIEIETRGVEITGPDLSRSTGSADEPFSVDVGIATNNLRSVSPQQEVRPHSTPYPLTLANGLRGVPLKVCSSNTAVGT